MRVRCSRGLGVTRSPCLDLEIILRANKPSVLGRVTLHRLKSIEHRTLLGKGLLERCTPSVLLATFQSLEHATVHRFRARHTQAPWQAYAGVPSEERHRPGLAP